MSFVYAVVEAVALAVFSVAVLVLSIALAVLVVVFVFYIYYRLEETVSAMRKRGQREVAKGIANNQDLAHAQAASDEYLYMRSLAVMFIDECNKHGFPGDVAWTYERARELNELYEFALARYAATHPNIAIQRDLGPELRQIVGMACGHKVKN